MKLEGLWQKRRETYLRRVMPYWRYVMSSGGVAMGFAVILAIQGYASLLNRARTADVGDPLFAWLPLGAAVILAAVMLWNRARTYIMQADLVFLLRRESGMKDYFRGAWRSGLSVSLAAAAAVLALYWPLYGAADYGSAGQYAAVCAALLALKALLYYGAWRERQFRYRSDRALFTSVKWMAALATAYALLGGVEGFAVVWSGAIWLAYALALRVPTSYRVHWEHLLEEERRTAALHEAWFCLFIDLPGRTETYKPRSYLNGWLKLIRYRKDNAYVYLYWRTLLRSSMFMIALRIVILELLMVWVFPYPWAAVFIYILFCWMLALQLRGLQSVWTEPLLAAMSPLPAALRSRSQRKVQRAANVIGALVMGIPLLFAATPLLAAVFAALGIASALLFSRPRRTASA